MNKKIRNYLNMIFKVDILKSILILTKIHYTNERQLGFPPVLLLKKTHTQISKSAKIIISGGKLYFNDSWTNFSTTPSLLNIDDNSTLRVNGNFHFYSGVKVYVHKNASLSLGSGYVNNDSLVRCSLKIDIGHDVLISEHVSILDSDYHHIIGHGDTIAKPIKIGNHVWIGLNSIILKGVTIGDNAIIGAGSLVNKDVPPNCLVGGVPARILRENVNWK